MDSHLNQLLQLARLNCRRGLFDEAEKILKNIFQIQSEAGNFESSETALALFYMGDSCRGQGHELQALPYFKMALRVWAQLEEFEPVPDELRDDAELFIRKQARAIMHETINTVQSMRSHRAS